MPDQHTLLGYEAEVNNTPPLPVTDGEPGRAIIFTDKEPPYNSVVIPMSIKGADELGKALLKPQLAADAKTPDIFVAGGKS